ncbi:hypothetical protein MASR1M60_09910 [Rhodocyclaceae bacterium]
MKYAGHPGVDANKIEPVDYVWKGEPLDELIGSDKQGTFDFIIASHVIEHITDIIGFLQQCSKLLCPTGVLSLIIPDKRYCFDYFRFPSSTGDALQAYLEKRKRHPPGVIFDHFASCCSLNQNIAWGKNYPGTLELIHSVDYAQEVMNSATSQGQYFDCHQWRFTPSSFKLIMQDLQNLGLIDLGEVISFDSEGCEFHTTLSKSFERNQLDRLTLLKQTLLENGESIIP